MTGTHLVDVGGRRHEPGRRAPSPYTVGKELGHGSDALVWRVYGHLGETRRRAEAVEYRVEQHAARLKDRLAALRVTHRRSRSHA